MATDKKKRTALDELLPPPAAVSSVVTGAVRRARVKQAPTDKSPRKIAEKNDVKVATASMAKHEIVKLMLYLPLPVADQLRGLHFEEQRGQAKKRKMHDYCLEAIDLLFKSRGLKSIEELTGRK